MKFHRENNNNGLITLCITTPKLFKNKMNIHLEQKNITHVFQSPQLFNLENKNPNEFNGYNFTP